MKTRAQLSLRQHGKLTPQLQLALKLLQYTQAELALEIENALAANPLLERNDTATDSETLPDIPEPLASRDDTDTPPPEDSTVDFVNAKTADALWDTLPEPRTLRSHLTEQLQLYALSRRDAVIGEVLIDSLDDEGYCQSSLDDLRTAAALLPVASDAEIEAVRHLIQCLDPAGAGSRTLSECLQVQLTQIVAEPALLQLAKAIAAQHLEHLAKGGIAAVVKAGRYDPDAVARAIALLKTLNPKPGAPFQHSRTEYIEPDFSVLRRRGSWQVQALRDPGHALRINTLYRKLARNHRGPDAAHLAHYLQEARWLIAGINTRRDTLMKVLNAVVNRQTPFLESGVSALQAMSMRDIAESIGLHESTVSRACSGKWLHTPHGVVALGSLFGTGIADATGTVQAAGAVQTKIAALIHAEPPEKPLSDARLQQLLADQGLPIARRTVTKYREALAIAPSHLRRNRGARSPQA